MHIERKRMIKWYQLFWKLLKKAKTPLILPLDFDYEVMNEMELNNLIIEYDIKELYYKAEIFDCDDFAWVFKGLASKRKIQPVGLVIGRRKGIWHCWNVVITEKGTYFIEPQTGRIVEKGYKAWIIII